MATENVTEAKELSKQMMRYILPEAAHFAFDLICHSCCTYYSFTTPAACFSRGSMEKAPVEEQKQNGGLVPRATTSVPKV